MMGSGAWQKSKRISAILIYVLFFGLALAVIRHEMQAYSLGAISDSVKSISANSIGLSLLATVISYLGIALYDGMALRYTDKSLPWYKSAFTSCCAHAISSTLGFAALTSNAVRFRLYSSWGMSLKDVAIIGSVTLLMSIMGAFSLIAVGLLAQTQTFYVLFKFPPGLSIALGVAILSIIGTSVHWILKSRADLSYKGLGFRKPTSTTLAIQWLGSIVDWIAAAAVLYVLIPASSDLTLLAFIPVFVAAQYLGTISGLPGGIGVFESIFLLLVPGGDVVGMAAALVVYRGIYYLFPLIVSMVLLTIQQGIASRALVQSGGRRAANVVSAIAPILYATLTFLTGAVMLVSSAMPAFVPRIEYMARLVPESIIELSHLFASAVGTLLLIVSLGMWRRLHNAWMFGILLFPAGAVFTYLKGGDITSIVLMVGLAMCLYSARPAFHRRGKISQLPLTSARLAALIGTVSLASWSGFYAYKNQAYSQEIWWNFGLQADASRFLRASALVAAIMLVYLVWRLLQPSRAPSAPESSFEIMEQVRGILDASNNSVSESNLALMGDKRFLFSKSGNSFIMYGVKGRNWIALGEPVGLKAERRELLLKFQETADGWGAWPCFYSIRSRNIHDFVDMGLSVQKIGEMALVPIENFDLAGKTKARFRQARNKAAREGVTFEVRRIEGHSNSMDRLEAISANWLEHHQGREKGFSLGRFDRKVLASQSIAVAIKNDEIIAFSNLWHTPDRTELSLDLMRYTQGCMTGVMEFLFTEVMLWGSAQGYKHFSLGAAPMSGLEAKNFTSFMSRIGRFVYKYGGRFYGFQGLRAFKKKFNPDWEPIYIAAPSQAAMPRALSNLALLSAGGLTGLMSS